MKMKALLIDLTKFLKLKQKKNTESNFTLKPYDLVDYYEEYPDLTLINENWVRVKVVLGGICGSDMHVMNLDNSLVLSSFTSLPAVPGHEIVGEIIELGQNVKDFETGDRIICDTNLSCESRGLEPCPQCREGNYNLCSNQDKGDISPGVVYGFCKDVGGGWGEYLLAHKNMIYKIPDNLSWEDALIAEPIACALHGILKHKPKNYEKCVVIGCGTIGLALITTLNALSNCKIYATARYDYQAELASQLGAEEVFITKKDRHIKKLARKLGAKTVTPPMETVYAYGGGADIVIDSVGNESSIKDSLRIIKPEGTLLLIGYPSHIKIDWTPMMAKEVTIITSNIFSYDEYEGKKERTMKIALDMISSNQVDVSKFLTHTFSIEDYRKALDVANSKSEYEAIKVAFKFK
ncbi:MAG: alcohol dehydrogenase catalytic domain-containing protein [Candidatus Lokiarchaeota archaeon]|nr:alcohol dehydrogenase catalytic domain-containing protein [Candidatus Lokiarchaeota archaeon]MBD3200733.1 alcohol dehydrogenase catalytic domain-containing protein [Candidatus Lokiarchaeota archaeon]